MTSYDTLTHLRPDSTQPSKLLETVPNPYADRDYTIDISTPEFTCLCPVTGQPDFAEIRILYVPDQRIVELKSLKLYLWSYRNEGIFHETVINKILDDLIRDQLCNRCGNRDYS